MGPPIRRETSSKTMGKADGDCTKATGIPATKDGKTTAVNRAGRGTAGVLCGVEAAVPLTF